MTTDIKRQFFDTFGIEPHYYCGNDYVFEAMLEYECTEGNREKCKTCKKVGKSYPQITDRILLELICILSQLQGRINDYYRIIHSNYEGLKIQILGDCICEKEFIKQQVQSLFKEG